MILPFGCRFDPTDEELLFFLEKKARGQPPPWDGAVVEKELYSASPWDVFKNDDPWQSCKLQHTIYVYTRVSKVGDKDKGKNKSRKAGSGRWHGQTGEENIIDSEKGWVLGSKRMFSYEADGGSICNTEIGHWIMHEYSTNLLASEYVICRIIRDDGKPLKVRYNANTRKRTSTSADFEEESSRVSKLVKCDESHSSEMLESTSAARVEELHTQNDGLQNYPQDLNHGGAPQIPESYMHELTGFPSMVVDDCLSNIFVDAETCEIYQDYADPKTFQLYQDSPSKEWEHSYFTTSMTDDSRVTSFTPPT